MPQWIIKAGAAPDRPDPLLTREFAVPDDLRRNARYVTRTMIAALEYSRRLMERGDVAWVHTEFTETH